MKKVLTLFAIFISFIMNAQNKDSIKKLKALRREGIIELAVSEIQKDYPEFNSKNYDRIKVMFNKKSMYVTFDNMFMFVPFNSSYYYGVYINLIEKTTAKSVLSNLDKDTLMSDVHFFVPDKKSNEAIEFVIDAINKSGSVGSIENRILPEGTSMTIYEKKTYYDISVDSESTYSSYKVKKGNGEIYDAGHKHKAIEPENTETFEELK